LKAEYERNGYVVIERAFPLSQMERIREAALQIVDAFDIDRHRSVFSTLDRDEGRDDYFVTSAEAIHCFLEEEALDGNGVLTQPKSIAINKIGHALHDLHPVFNTFCRQALLADTLKEIGYIQPQLWQTMYIFKQPRIGGEVRWHQDASYLITRPRSVVGFWVAVEDAHRDNGCLWVHPGGHHSPLRDVYRYDHSARNGELVRLSEHPWPALQEAVAVEVPAGSLVIFHDHMPHYSSPNRSEHSRQAFTMHFAEAKSQWPEENWLQRPSLGPFRI